MYRAGDVRVEDVPDARLVEPTDALVRVTRACICGSDLWPYKTMEPSVTGRRIGHEAIGVVDAVGGDVRTLNVGDFVVMPFAFSDGSCAFCREGLQTSCIHGGFFGTSEVAGAQAEAVRVPLADGTLYVLPAGEDDALAPSLLTLSDVMGTGHHGAVGANVSPGKTAAVVGDGAGVATDVLRQPHRERRRRAGPRVHRGASAGHPRRPDRAGPCLRPGRRPRRGARRLPGDERPRSDQGRGETMISTMAMRAAGETSYREFG